MLLTKCLICSESINFSNLLPSICNDTTRISSKRSFFRFFFIYCLIDLTQRGYVRQFSYFLSCDPFSLSLSFSEKANKYEAKQVNMRGNLKYV